MIRVGRPLVLVLALVLSLVTVLGAGPTVAEPATT